MRQSQLFTKTIKTVSKDEESANIQFLARGGFVDKLMSGVYSYLPLGFLVFKKIEKIIRDEINNIGGQEVLLPVLHPKNNWEKTNRWQHKEMFKLKSRAGKDYGLGWTHEEIITPLMKKFVQSYKNLPVYVYQIQDKFRDELRAKSGLLRGTEFIMKDLYSFHNSEEDLNGYYEKVKASYFKIFKRCGLEKQTFLTCASGGVFSKYSHEFQTITPYGEDKIYLCEGCKLAVNKEIIEEEKYQCPKCKNNKLKIEKSIEVGNIFKLKNKFSKAFDFKFKDKDGKEKDVIMGCYGIGLGRLMGTIVEIYHDEKGIVWPTEVAPFLIHLIQIENNQKIKKAAENLYKNLSALTFQKRGYDESAVSFGGSRQTNRIEVLYDDRNTKTPGEKFNEADLMGIPYRILVSEKTLKTESVEVKKRNETKIRLVKIKQIINFFKKFEEITIKT